MKLETSWRSLIHEKVKIFAGKCGNDKETEALEKKVNEWVADDKLDGWQLAHLETNMSANFWGETWMTITICMEKD